MTNIFWLTVPSQKQISIELQHPRQFLWNNPWYQSINKKSWALEWQISSGIFTFLVANTLLNSNIQPWFQTESSFSLYQLYKLKHILIMSFIRNKIKKSYMNCNATDNACHKKPIIFLALVVMQEIYFKFIHLSWKETSYQQIKMFLKQIVWFQMFKMLWSNFFII